MITEHRGSIRTRVQANVLPRKLGFFAALATVPMGVGALVGVRSKRAGIVAGGLTAAALLAVRWQLQRWFTEEPAYETEQRLGELELRRIKQRVEARVHIDNQDFDASRERGFRQLAGYLFGSNPNTEKLAMTSPVTMAKANGGHEMAFIMPEGRTLMSLPRPNDPGVTLREAPERRVAVLRIGGYSAANVEKQERRLRSLVAKAGLTAFGPVTFAGFDPPWTLGLLKRTELWLEIE